MYVCIYIRMYIIYAMGCIHMQSNIHIFVNTLLYGHCIHICVYLYIDKRSYPAWERRWTPPKMARLSSASELENVLHMKPLVGNTLVSQDGGMSINQRVPLWLKKRDLFFSLDVDFLDEEKSSECFFTTFSMHFLVENPAGKFRYGRHGLRKNSCRTYHRLGVGWDHQVQDENVWPEKPEILWIQRRCLLIFECLSRQKIPYTFEFFSPKRSKLKTLTSAILWGESRWNDWWGANLWKKNIG